MCDTYLFTILIFLAVRPDVIQIRCQIFIALFSTFVYYILTPNRVKFENTPPAKQRDIFRYGGLPRKTEKIQVPARVRHTDRQAGGRPTKWATVITVTTWIISLSGLLAEFGFKKRNTDGDFPPSTQINS